MGSGERSKLPPARSRRSPGPKTSFGVFRAWKNTPDGHKSVVFDICAAYLVKFTSTITEHKTQLLYLFLCTAKTAVQFFPLALGARPQASLWLRLWHTPFSKNTYCIKLYFESDCLDCFSPIFATATEKSFSRLCLTAKIGADARASRWYTQPITYASSQVAHYFCLSLSLSVCLPLSVV